ncbi:MAG: hypothetical protein K9G33_13305 [Sneathiella sp.]|nr:hypothetical protein [Sneathiella sp.]
MNRCSHGVGAPGAARLTRVYDFGWAKRGEGSRIVSFSASGEKEFQRLFPVQRRQD